MQTLWTRPCSREEFEIRQSLWTRPCNNDNDTDEEDDNDTLTGDEQSELVFISNSVEINWRRASAEEKREFLKPGGSDESEWRGLLKTNPDAIRVHSGSDAASLRALWPGRIVPSRMVRRWKAQPGVNAPPKAKSRWCVQGFRDPDGGELHTYSPTPPVETMMLFLQMTASMQFTIAVADVKQAFLQSDPLARSKGPVLVEPCEGVPLQPGDLIELRVAVYGLDDAPWQFRCSLTRHLARIGLRRAILDPCLWLQHRPDGSLQRMVLLDVDDLIMASTPEEAARFKRDIEGRFELGKYERDKSSFCGRRISCTAEWIEVDMEKYIVEDLATIDLSRSQRKQKEDRLEEDDMKQLRSLIYKLNWIGRETRPEVCGIASMLAARLKDCTVQDVITANKAVQYLKGSKGVTLKLWRIPWDRLHLVTYSDAGGVLTKDVGVWSEGTGPTDATQGAWLIFACDGLPKTEELVKLSPLMWKSSKLKRKVPSTLAGEALALSEAVASVEWCQMMLRDVKSNNLDGDFQWEKSCGPFALTMSPQCALADRVPQGHTIDAKAVFDALQREAAGCKADRRAAVDLSLIHSVVERTKA
eukprot:6492342-Amphidinium_carterae.1